MRKTKKLRKINKFTNKNKVGGMYPVQVNDMGERHAFGILGDITRSLTRNTHDMEIIKRDIILLINKFKALSIQDKIAFVELLSSDFNEYHHRNPILIELYYMQIITLIDATLTLSVFNPRSVILAKLSNDTMRMISAACMTMSPEVPPSLMPPQPPSLLLPSLLPPSLPPSPPLPQPLPQPAARSKRSKRSRHLRQ